MSAIGIMASGKASYKKLDTDASAYITASGLSSKAHKAAVNVLVKEFKVYSLWTKCVAIYPFVGGTAALHKWNLKDPRDLDAAFRLTFGGTNTHNSTGYVPTASSGIADTKIIPSTHLTNNNVHLSFYCHNNGSLAATTNPEIGSQNNTGQRLTQVGKGGANAQNFDSYNVTVGQGRCNSSNATTTVIFIVGSRLSSTNTGCYRNGVSSGTAATSGGTVPTVTTYINGITAVLQVDAARTYCFASVGTGLTSTEVLNMYNKVVAFNLSLQRLGS